MARAVKKSPTDRYTRIFREGVRISFQRANVANMTRVPNNDRHAAIVMPTSLYEVNAVFSCRVVGEGVVVIFMIHEDLPKHAS